MIKIPSLNSITAQAIAESSLPHRLVSYSGFSSLTPAAAMVAELVGGETLPGPYIVVLPSENAVDQFLADFHFFSPKVSPLRLTGLDVSPFSGLYPSAEKIAQRLGWLYAAGIAKDHEIFVGSSEFFQQLVPPPEFFTHRTWQCKIGDSLPEAFTEKLLELGYRASPLVEGMGQFATKGGIIDVFSPIQAFPIRIELFGDEIESLRYFDVESQMSTEATETLTICPAREVLLQSADRERLCQKLRRLAEASNRDDDDLNNLVRYIARGDDFSGSEFLSPLTEASLSPVVAHFARGFTLFEIFPDDITNAWEEALSFHRQNLAEKRGMLPFSDIAAFFLPNRQTFYAQSLKTIQFERVHVQPLAPEFIDGGSLRIVGAQDLNRFKLQQAGHTYSPHSWQKIMNARAEGKSIIIASGSETQARRLSQLIAHRQLAAKEVAHGEQPLSEMIEEQRQTPEVLHIVLAPISSSFALEDDDLIFLSEDLLLSKSTEHRPRSKGASVPAHRVFTTTDLSPNDFVVHALHGIGVFEGLKLMTVGGIAAEFIQVRYRDNDRLYLPIYRIGQLQKYSAGHFAPPIDKLGSGNWEKTKIRVRSHLRDIASDLLKLYSQRKLVKRTALPPINEDFLAFAGAFPYDETPDQERTIEDVLKDFQRDYPMDRLVCGDVGFGKTEIAMRAAFKMVQAHKQVAVLSPTTVLSFQHLRTFRQRFANWPVTIEVLNRFISIREQKSVLAKVKEGQVDIIIGTHRLLSQDVQFANLGLVIIDEEHRFGVKQKEMLKRLRLNVDCLALSATPIPRTLNMAFLGVRDLSLITTPPSDRHPIRTFLQTYSAERAAEAIRQEVARGGQVYFIHNRIKSIYAIGSELKEALPKLRIQVAHGQMPEGELEKIMVDFFEGRIDVLVCTTIVESGVDVASANTMLIHDAHTFGLSQLYQLRGRIGRSKQRAYCHLFVPPNVRLDKEAGERLKIMEQHTALGSGFYISQHDLELRGSGNLLGEEQSGHIQAVGYELYLELLEEALYELRHKKPMSRVIDPEINLRIPALIPDQYISDIRLRLAIYKELAEIKSENDIDQMERRLTDQFGKPPEPVINLLGVMLIRNLCKELAILDISGSGKSVTIKVGVETPIEPKLFLELQRRFPKKYSLTAQDRFRINISGQNWAEVYEELRRLKTATTFPK